MLLFSNENILRSFNFVIKDHAVVFLEKIVVVIVEDIVVDSPPKSFHPI